MSEGNQIPYYPEREADTKLLQDAAKHLERTERLREIFQARSNPNISPIMDAALEAEHRQLVVSQGNSTSRTFSGGVWREQPRKLSDADRAQVAAIDKRLATEQLKSTERLALYDKKTAIYSGRNSRR